MPDAALTSPVEALLRDMLLWLDERPRTYAEAIDAWRTSCPRLPVWEDAHDRGFVVHAREDGAVFVRVTPRGHAFANAHG